MRHSGSDIRLGLKLGLVLYGFGVLWACTQLNPDFDPDGGPVCSVGERSCDATSVLLCGPNRTTWVMDRVCFGQTTCEDSACVPDHPNQRCVQLADCTSDASNVCTVVVDSEASEPQLGTFCLEPPNPSGRFGGQACSVHEHCRSGWCFRGVCYEACTDASQCTNTNHQCDRLDITVDGVRDSMRINGCVP